MLLSFAAPLTYYIDTEPSDRAYEEWNLAQVCKVADEFDIQYSVVETPSSIEISINKQNISVSEEGAASIFLNVIETFRYSVEVNGSESDQLTITVWPLLIENEISDLEIDWTDSYADEQGQYPESRQREIAVDLNDSAD